MGVVDAAASGQVVASLLVLWVGEEWLLIASATIGPEGSTPTAPPHEGGPIPQARAVVVAVFELDAAVIFAPVRMKLTEGPVRVHVLDRHTSLAAAVQHIPDADPTGG